VYTTGTNAMPVIPGEDPPSATTLTADQWEHGTILTTDAVWYKFEVTSGTTYRVWWNNRTYGPAQNTKTGDVVVGARYAGSDTWIFGGTPTSVIGGWPSGVYTNPPSFTASQDGTVYVRVSLYNNNIINVGTFALVYSAGTTRPGLEPPAWTGSTTLTINNTDAWNEALTKLKGQTGQYTLTINGDIGVSGVVYGGGLFDAVPYSFGTTEDGFPLQVTLNGNGTLYTTAGSELFVCGAGQTVIIDSATLTLDGRYGGSSVIRVYAGGTLELKNGTITGAHGSIAVSPGVIVYGGTFIMRGGKISGNGGESGGGVYVCPDLSSVPGTFTMYGGEISGNTVTAGNSSIFPGRGGGVYVYDATFTMHGGKIFGNTATSSTATAGAFGGGVCVYGASTGTGGNFTMLGGEIYGNTASGTLGMGGGVYVDRGTFRIVEGTIYGSDEAGKDDNDNDLKNTATLGAALYKTDNGTAQHGTFTGATFSGTDLIESGNAIEDTIIVP
jgi:hypothetical protein